ncbi:MAG TPA: hypothetical protein VGB37_13285 [Candidatus Lokiarchaeia archaeon]
MFITFMLLLCSTAILNAYLEREHKKGIKKRIKESPSKLLSFGYILFFISVTIMVYIILIFPPEKIESDFGPIMIILFVIDILALIIIIVGFKVIFMNRHRA